MPVTEVQKSSGTVSSIEGSATVRDTDAQVRQLAVGDEINVGDVVNFDGRSSTSPSPSIIVDFDWDFSCRYLLNLVQYR